jgi:hypothetical protein
MVFQLPMVNAGRLLLPMLFRDTAVCQQFKAWFVSRGQKPEGTDSM